MICVGCAGRFWRNGDTLMRALPAGVHCIGCRSELLREALTTLVCPGCPRRYWQRGGEVVPEGSYDAIDVPDTRPPTARAKIRKRDD